MAGGVGLAAQDQDVELLVAAFWVTAASTVSTSPGDVDGQLATVVTFGASRPGTYGRGPTDAQRLGCGRDRPAQLDDALYQQLAPEHDQLRPTIGHKSLLGWDLDTPTEQ
jgi:hypothetical protein